MIGQLLSLELLFWSLTLPQCRRTCCRFSVEIQFTGGKKSYTVVGSHSIIALIPTKSRRRKKHCLARGAIWSEEQTRRLVANCCKKIFSDWIKSGSIRFQFPEWRLCFLFTFCTVQLTGDKKRSKKNFRECTKSHLHRKSCTDMYVCLFCCF